MKILQICTTIAVAILYVLFYYALGGLIGDINELRLESERIAQEIQDIKKN